MIGAIDGKTSTEQRLPPAPQFGKLYRVEILAQPPIDNKKLCSIFSVWCENSGAQWMRRQIPNNQRVGKIRQVDGFERLGMLRPHGGKRLYNLKPKARADGE